MAQSYNYSHWAGESPVPVVMSGAFPDGGWSKFRPETLNHTFLGNFHYAINGDVHVWDFPQRN